MATYPIKMLKDEEGIPFVPLVSIEAIGTESGETVKDKLDKKLEASNLIAGSNIGLSVEGNNITISSTGIDPNIDNLVNYYKKEQTYSKEEVDAIILALEQKIDELNSNLIARLSTLTTLDGENTKTAGDTSE